MIDSKPLTIPIILFVRNIFSFSIYTLSAVVLWTDETTSPIGNKEPNLILSPSRKTVCFPPSNLKIEKHVLDKNVITSPSDDSIVCDPLPESRVGLTSFWLTKICISGNALSDSLCNITGTRFSAGSTSVFADKPLRKTFITLSRDFPFFKAP